MSIEGNEPLFERAGPTTLTMDIEEWEKMRAALKTCNAVFTKLQAGGMPPMSFQSVIRQVHDALDEK